MTDKSDIQSKGNGYFDIVYSPDDGGFYADLMFSCRIPPTFDSAIKAEAWARKHGGKVRLR